MRRTTFGLAPFLWLMLVVISTESRSINGTVEDGNATEEDYDLENALFDYYDTLMELWGVGQKTEDNQEVAEEGEKLKREHVGANHPSGLLSNAPGGSDNNTQSYFDLAIPIQIGNITYRFLNESYAAVLDRQRTGREREENEDNTANYGIKNLRLSSIRDSVLGLRGGNSTQNSTVITPKQTNPLKELFEKQAKGGSAWSTTKRYVEKSQSYFPSCELPRNTDEPTWLDPNAMNLFFDVVFPTPQQDSTLMVVNAALKLYTIAQGGSSFVPGNFTAPEFPTYRLMNDDDKRIRISVYWHTRSLRRQRIKKKLLDSQVVSPNVENTLTFDIRPAVRGWKESGKNFGLQIIVEDDNGTLQRPSDYIHPMNCSKSAASVKPLPLFGFDSPAQYFINDATVVEHGNKSTNESDPNGQGSFPPYLPVKYPMVGVQVRDVSISEVQNLAKLKSIQMELASKYNKTGGRQKLFPDTVNSSRNSSTSRIMDFENVPLGMPLSQNSTTKQTRDVNMTSLTE